jgi:hypothetical protein
MDYRASLASRINRFSVAPGVGGTALACVAAGKRNPQTE